MVACVFVFFFQFWGGVVVGVDVVLLPFNSF